MHPNPAATQTPTGTKPEPVNGYRGPSLTVLRKPGDMIGALTQGRATAPAGDDENVPAGRPAAEAAVFLAGYYLG